MPPRPANQQNRVAPAQVAPITRLQDLPAEVLTNIFHFLWIYNEPEQTHLTSRPSCKSLQLVADEQLYRNITISKNGNLGDLANSLFANSLHGTWIQSLKLSGKGGKIIKGPKYAKLLELNLENSLNSLTELKVLEVEGWHLVGKVVLTGTFGQRGGRKLEKLILDDCFQDIIGPVSTALNNLRHLPNLTSIDYCYETPAREVPLNLDSTEIGFAKVNDLTFYTCFDQDVNHNTNIISLFPLVASLELVQMGFETRPNFFPCLVNIAPDSVTGITLNCTNPPTIAYTDERPPIEEVLSRFTSLAKVYFLDGRELSSELIDYLCSTDPLNFVEISPVCQISFDLCCELLSKGMKNKQEGIKYGAFLNLDVEPGEIGKPFREGGEPTWKDGTLVLGNGWKRPIWNEEVMTKLEAEHLVKLAKENGITLSGSITEALVNEDAVQEEENWLKEVMSFARRKKNPVDQKVKKEELF